MKAKLILAGLVLCLSTQSHAIGDVEKGALIGAGSLIILNKIFGGSGNDGGSYQRYEAPPQRYYAPAPTYNYYQYPQPTREVIIIEKHPRHPEQIRREQYYRDQYYRGYR